MNKCIICLFFFSVVEQWQCCPVRMVLYWRLTVCSRWWCCAHLWPFSQLQEDIWNGTGNDNLLYTCIYMEGGSIYLNTPISQSNHWRILIAVIHQSVQLFFYLYDLFLNFKGIFVNVTRNNIRLYCLYDDLFGVCGRRENSTVHFISILPQMITMLLFSCCTFRFYKHYNLKIGEKLFPIIILPIVKKKDSSLSKDKISLVFLSSCL